MKYIVSRLDMNLLSIRTKMNIIRAILLDCDRTDVLRGLVVVACFDIIVYGYRGPNKKKDDSQDKCSNHGFLFKCV